MEIDINNPEHGNQIVSPDNLHTDPLPEGQEGFYVGEPKVEATQVATNSVPTNPPTNV
jgi:hypothetical protein